MAEKKYVVQREQHVQKPWGSREKTTENAAWRSETVFVKLSCIGISWRAGENTSSWPCPSARASDLAGSGGAL